MYVTREAEQDLATLAAVGPVRGTWGLIVGHRRGPVLFAERLFPVGALDAKNDPGAALQKVSRLRGGDVVGAFAVRPGARERRSFLGPAFFGRVLLEVEPGRRGLKLKPRLVDFDGRFFFAAAALRRPAAGRHDE